MKTVGEIIHSERLKKDFSLDKLSALTKIDVKYLEHLENNRYDHLPSETFIKGFIRNVALHLDKEPDELIAIFRRDFRSQDKKYSSKVSSPPRAKLFFEPARLVPYLFGILVFLVYLGFQFRAVLTPPRLEIIKPLTNTVTISPLEIEGLTELDSQVSIGNEIKVRPDNTGHFSVKMSVPIGETTLNFKATNRFGRSTTKQVTVTVISK